MASIEKDRYHGQSFNQLLGIKAFSLVGFPEANLLFLFCIQGFIKDLLKRRLQSYSPSLYKGFSKQVHECDLMNCKPDSFESTISFYPGLTLAYNWANMLF